MSKSITLTVTGMKCGGCENTVTEKLFADEGVLTVNASHKNNFIAIKYEDAETNPEAIKQIITVAGYSVA